MDSEILDILRDALTSSAARDEFVPPQPKRKRKKVISEAPVGGETASGVGEDVHLGLPEKAQGDGISAGVRKEKKKRRLISKASVVQEKTVSGVGKAANVEASKEVFDNVAPFESGRMPLDQAVISYDGRQDLLKDSEGLATIDGERLSLASLALEGSAYSGGHDEGERRDPCMGEVDPPASSQHLVSGLAGTPVFSFTGRGVSYCFNALKLAFVAGTRAALEVQGVSGSKSAARILTLPQALRATEESIPPLVPEGGMRMVLGSSKGPLDYEAFVRSSEIMVARALGVHEAAVMSWNHAKEREEVIIGLNSEVQRLGVELSKCQSEVSLLRADNLVKQNSLTDAQNSLTNAQASLLLKEEGLASAQASLIEKEKILGEIRTSNDILKKGKEDADRQIGELRAELEKKEDFLVAAERSRDNYKKIISEAAIKSFQNALAQVRVLYPYAEFDKVRPHYVVEGNDIVEKLPGGERQVVFQGEESDTETHI